jgi:pimeloyl-ACP methyl ester carboxylesterase
LDFRISRFAGHDRGGRVAYRMALDHPNRVGRLAVLDVLSTETVWDRADARFALAFWPWSLLAQPEPLPQRILAAAPEAIVDNALGDGALLRLCSLRKFVRPMYRLFEILLTHMLSVRSIEPPRPSTASMIKADRAGGRDSLSSLSPVERPRGA